MALIIINIVNQILYNMLKIYNSVTFYLSRFKEMETNAIAFCSWIVPIEGHGFLLNCILNLKLRFIMQKYNIHSGR